MNESFFLGLIHNVALLLATGLLSDFYMKKDKHKISYRDKIITGLIFGFVGVIIMLTPWILIPGIIFDTRSVLLSTSGLYFGYIPTIIAMGITLVLRIMQGGDGMWMGIAVIASSGIIGLLWRKYRANRNSDYKVTELLVMGFLVHICMLVFTILLPANRQIPTLSSIALPVLTIYPIGNVLFGLILNNRFKQWQTKRALQE
ncbi:MAG: hypothetical protein NTU44_14210 [Bacteroidetes bacterium]|nr:hypothetical protein [Bacteroidota bacterium]